MEGTCTPHVWHSNCDHAHKACQAGHTLLVSRILFSELSEVQLSSTQSSTLVWFHAERTLIGFHDTTIHSQPGFAGPVKVSGEGRLNAKEHVTPFLS